jgi:plasmid stabilization system protein ParE
VKLIWRPQAEAELFSIVDYVSRESPAAAVRLHERIVFSASQLLQFPLGFRASVEPGVRELIRKTPCICSTPSRKTKL